MMLIGINSILSPDFLAPLRVKRHGGEIAIVDVNYPALEHARRLIRLDGLTLRSVMDAVSSGLPVNEIHHQIVKTCKNMYQKNQ
jgi:L-fucose mutarotase